MNKNAVWIIILISVLVFLNYNNPSSPVNENSNNDNIFAEENLNALVEPKIAFTAVNMFKTGTALSSETARMLLFNGDGKWKDLGVKNMDGTSYKTQPDSKYKIYYFMSATTPNTQYYTYVEDYTAPAKESVDSKVAYGCEIDTSPTFISKDSSDRIQSETANAESLGANSVTDVTITIKSHSDKCVGTPNAPKSNAVCFAYSSTHYDFVKTNTGYLSIPSSVSSHVNVSGNVVSCYNFPVLKDGGQFDVSVNIDSAGTDPTTAQDILVIVDDINVDLDASTLDEIWGYTDESGNQLGMNATYIGKIHMS